MNSTTMPRASPIAICPRLMEACPRDGPTEFSWTISIGAFNRPEFSTVTRRRASSGSKSPSIWALPPVMTSFTCGALCTIPSSAIGISRPCCLASRVASANCSAPSSSRESVTLYPCPVGVDNPAVSRCLPSTRGSSSTR